MPKQLKRYICIPKKMSLFGASLCLPLQAWPGGLEPGEKVTGDAFRWETTCPPFCVLPQRNLLSWEVFSLDGDLAAKMKPGFFVSECTLVPGLGTGTEQLVIGRWWWSSPLVAPSPSHRATFSGAVCSWTPPRVCTCVWCLDRLPQASDLTLVSCFERPCGYMSQI